MHSSFSTSMPATPASALATRYSLLATHYPLVVAVMIGAALRLVGLTRQGFWTDELYVVWEARQPLDMVLNPQLHIHHPPGYRLALHAWMGLGGVGEFWLRLLPALAGVLLIVVAWALARALWPDHFWAAGGAAILVATSPFLVHYSQDVTTYSWTALWVSLSVLFLVRAWREDRAWLWAAWGVSMAVSLYSHYFSIFPVAVEVIAALALGVVEVIRKGIRKKDAVEQGMARRAFFNDPAIARLTHAILAVVGAALLFAPWVWTVLTNGGKALSPIFFPVSVDTQPVGWVPTLFAGYANESFWQSDVGKWIVWGLLGVLFLWAGWRLSRVRSRRGALAAGLVLAWGVAAIVGPYLFLRLTTPPEAITPVRFAAMAAPALMLGLGALVGSLPALGRALLLGGWLALSGVQLYGEYAAPPKQDWRGIMATVEREALPGDEMLGFTAFHAGAAAAYYSVPVDVKGGWFVGRGEDPAGAAFWFPPEWRWRGFLETDAYSSTDFQGEMQRRIEGAQRLWYLAGDGTDGTYKPSPAAERALSALGWQPTQEWRASPLVLRLYVRTGGQ